MGFGGFQQTGERVSCSIGNLMARKEIFNNYALMWAKMKNIDEISFVDIQIVHNRHTSCLFIDIYVLIDV